MGLMSNIVKQWHQKNEDVLSLQCMASDRSGIVLNISKVIRMILQILILGVGAYYVTRGEITSGAMIAASIIMGRALAPIEQSIGVWKQAISVMQAANRLHHYLTQPQPRATSLELPKPKGQIDVESLLYIPPSSNRPVLHGVQFSLSPGESLCIVGPSGAGKSTLARLLVGVWAPNDGCVRLDGANIYEWNRDDIGNHVGYLPQGGMLFKGSVKENIARMGDVEDNKIIAAAKFIEAHEMILRLSKGYDTDTSTYDLSGGQKQMIALARAFYQLPRFVVLDEPESNLDQAGLAALEIALKRAKGAGITLIMITQRSSLIPYCDHVIMMNNGHIEKMDMSTHENS
jgi:PrtD family type I secretion system ABC transporter